jgi:hypothetical protein
MPARLESPALTVRAAASFNSPTMHKSLREEVRSDKAFRPINGTWDLIRPGASRSRARRYYFAHVIRPLSIDAIRSRITAVSILEFWRLRANDPQPIFTKLCRGSALRIRYLEIRNFRGIKSLAWAVTRTQ